MLDVADNNAAYYYHFDGLGSVVALSNSYGNSCQSYQYSVYGQVAASDPDFLANPYMFTGRRFDIETGLYYYRARYYNPYIGRFMQTDPVGYEDGINWYLYCKNNPLILVDPSGLWAYLEFEWIDQGSYKYLTVKLMNENGTCADVWNFDNYDDYYEYLDEFGDFCDLTLPSHDDIMFWRKLGKINEMLETDELANKQWLTPSALIELYGSWDSAFYEEENRDRLYEIQGEYGYGWEVNYFAVGALMKHRGLTYGFAKALVIGWNLTQNKRLGNTDSAWHFFDRGYNEYNKAASWVDPNVDRSINNTDYSECILF